MHFRTTAVATILAFAAGAAWSHGGSLDNNAAKKPAQMSAQEPPFGRAGDPGRVVRTIRVGMDDTMHFTATAAAQPHRKSDVKPADGPRLMPGDIVVKQGETIRFIARNNGKVMHEMVIGTLRELKDHAELMRKFPGMEHEEPYMAHVAPDKQGEIVWQFTQTGDFYYACLVPGHMEAGMISKITVE
jgi:uncharacterized cupredoxin-like copper-binding protein